MEKESIVYLLQELPGTGIGQPKFNIMGAQKYGKLKVLLKENSQIILSTGPIMFELRRLLKDYTSKDYLIIKFNTIFHLIIFSKRFSSNANRMSGIFTSNSKKK